MPRPHLGPTAPAALLTVLLTASPGIPATGAPSRAAIPSLPASSRASSLAGQAVPEIAALTVQGSPPTDVAHTLIHEATHLLVGRTLGHTVPLWLDEGLAGALELERIDRRGRLIAGPLRARPGGLGVRGRLEGPLAALAGLLADAHRGRLERLDDLLALERIDLYRSPRRRELYALTALWVRYLLEGEGGEHAPRFRVWLAAAADDPPLREDAADGTASLPDRLGRTPEELDRGFRTWLHDLASRLGLAPGEAGRLPGRPGTRASDDRQLNRTIPPSHFSPMCG